MAYFAEIKNNIVMRVIVADDINFCIQNLGGQWIETFIDDPVKNYAGIGHTYDIGKDNFIAQKPFNSWVLDPTCKWIPPLPVPIDTSLVWNEKLQGFTNTATAIVDNNSLIL